MKGKIISWQSNKRSGVIAADGRLLKYEPKQLPGFPLATEMDVEFDLENNKVVNLRPAKPESIQRIPSVPKQSQQSRAAAASTDGPRPNRGQPAAHPSALPAAPVGGYRFLNPYNFVRLPERKVESGLFARQAPVEHSRYQGLTGYIDCRLEAVTPLFISHGTPMSEDSNGHKTYSFFEVDGKPILPASSLRGMIRNVYETITGSCFSVFDDKQLFRRMSDRESQNLLPGRVVYDERSGDLSLQLFQYSARVCCYPNSRNRARPVDLKGLRHGDACWAVVTRRGILRTVTQVARSRAEAETLLARLPNRANATVEEGWLMITGRNFSTKQYERFFYNPAGVLDLTDSAIEEYNHLIDDYLDIHKDDLDGGGLRGQRGVELSHFMHNPRKLSRSKEANGILVYAVKNGTQAEHLAPVMIGRRAFKDTVGKLLPDHLHPCTDYDHLCPACRAFGWVDSRWSEDANNRSDKRVAYAGRIGISYGTLVNEGSGRVDQITLAELSAPKPTTTFFYLTDKAGKGEFIGKMTGYDASAQRLRGRKVYRHHREGTYPQSVTVRTKRNRTIQGAFKPGTEWQFRIHFHNLAPEELGALLWSIELEPGMYHRLGYGKPLGMGSVKVSVARCVTYDLARRYTDLSDHAGEVAVGQPSDFVHAFKSAIGEAYGTTFAQWGSVKDLRALLSAHPKDDLPIHYPRPDTKQDGENFKWFMAAAKNPSPDYALPLADQDEGLPMPPIGQRR